MPARRLIRILSIDGGGIRGISALYILRTIMLRVAQSIDSSAKVPADPHSHFDLIVGAGTGGLIALMLGRLRMSVDESIREYQYLAKTAFQPKSSIKSWFNVGTLYPVEKLEDSVKLVIARSPNPNDFGLKENESSRATTTRSAIVVVQGGSIEPQLFRSYPHHGTSDGCTMWQAVRATTAVSIFFKSFKIKRVSYIDDLGKYNNPADLAFEEARGIWPGKKVCLLSIGTGSQTPIVRA